MQRQGRRRFLKFVSRYSPSLSLQPTCPKNPHDPYPHNHTLQALWKKNETETHALHLNRVWQTSPPTAYKYRRGRTKKRGGNQRQLVGVGIFGEGKSNQKKKRLTPLHREENYLPHQPPFLLPQL